MTGTYNTVVTLLNKKDYTQAESLLNKFNTQDATWHYLYGSLMIKKSWFEKGRMHLEKATELDPTSKRYEMALAKLMSRGPRYSDDYYDRRPYRRRRGCGCCCCDDCCDCDCCEVSCCDLICLDSCCECMGGDLISCI